MKYKILSLDENGKISFTKEELEKLLDEVYTDGYQEGKKAGNIQYVPYPQVSNLFAQPYNPLNPNPYIIWLGPNDVPPSFSTSDNSYSTNTSAINTKGE